MLRKALNKGSLQDDGVSSGRKVEDDVYCI
jgi:hypothetical protein